MTVTHILHSRPSSKSQPNVYFTVCNGSYVEILQIYPHARRHSNFLVLSKHVTPVVIAHNVYYLLLCIEDQILFLNASAVLPTAAIVI